MEEIKPQFLGIMKTKPQRAVKRRFKKERLKNETIREGLKQYIQLNLRTAIDRLRS